MKRPGLRWRQQRECKDNETANKIGIETGMVTALLALLLGLVVSLERNHQRKESRNDATGAKHQNSPKFDGVDVDIGYGLQDPAWLLDEGH